MTTVHRELTFASFLFPAAGAGRGLLDQAVLTEQLGYDLIGVPDHLDWPLYVDQWTLLSAIIGRTETIEVFSCVSSLALREPPAALAKAAWSIDRLAPGRFHLGLGSGALPGIVTIGGPTWTTGESVARVREAIDLIRMFHSGSEQEVSFDGDYYRLAGAKLPPAPPQPIPIWLGVVKPRMLALAGEKADGWIPGMTLIDPEVVREDTKRVDEAILAAGRELSDVRRVYNTIAKKLQPKSEGFLIGPVSQWIEELTLAALELGFDTFVVGDREATVEHLHRIAEEVVAAVREKVARARAASGEPSGAVAAGVGA